MKAEYDSEADAILIELEEVDRWDDDVRIDEAMFCGVAFRNKRPWASAFATRRKNYGCSSDAVRPGRDGLDREDPGGACRARPTDASRSRSDRVSRPPDRNYSPVGLIRKSVFEESENLIQQWSGGTSAMSIRACEMRLAISVFCSSERPSYQWTSTNGMGGRRRRR